MPLNRSTAAVLHSIGKSLTKEVIDEPTPSLVRCQELIQSLYDEVGQNSCNMTIALLQTTQIGITLGKTIKACRRYKRTSDQSEEWATLMNTSQQLLTEWKQVVANETTTNKPSEVATQEDDHDAVALQGTSNSHLTSAVYRARLLRQGKEMFKDPPALPPLSIEIDPTTCPLPKRDKTTGVLTFVALATTDELSKKIIGDFHPNRTPAEILRAGSFGGTYFRPIVSAVTNVRYIPSQVLADTVQPSWIEGLDQTMYLTSETYRPQVNKYSVKCGGSLGMWESSGWIADSDPYGWFQWYCRFYQGRRCTDDARQVSRWLKSAGPKGRFRSQLCNKIVAANTEADDALISPVIRQTLLHWGLEITESVLGQHKKRVR